MTVQKTNATVAETVETKNTTKVATTTKSTKKTNFTRVVVELPKEQINNLKILSDLLGKPQHELISQSCQNTLDKHQALISNFLQLREQSAKLTND